MANRYLVSGGTGDYDSTTNWSTTSGGASGASKPTAADAIIIDANSANANLFVNTANSCLSFTESNYTGTVTINDVLSVVGTTNTGNITLSAGSTFTGTGTLRKVPTGVGGNIRTNSVILDCNLEFAPTVSTTTVFTGACVVNKNVILSTVSSTITTSFSSGALSIEGNLVVNHKLSGTTINFTGSNPTTFTNTATSTVNANLTFNKSGGAIVNIVDLYFGTSSTTITWTAGILNHTGTIFTQGQTWNTSAVKWNIIEFLTANANFTSTLNATTIRKNTINWVFNGGAPLIGFNVDYFLYDLTSNGGSVVRFKTNTIYNITNSLIINVSSPSGVITVSTPTANLKASINLGSNAFMKLYNCTLTDIIATNKTLRVVKGTITANRNTNCFALSSNLNPYSNTF